MKSITAAAMATAAVIALSACSSNTRWEPSATYQPAVRIKPTPAELTPSQLAYRNSIQLASKKGRKRAVGAVAIALANKASVRDVRSDEMCGFAWCIPDFDTNQLHIMYVKNGELSTIEFPEGEKVEGQFFGSIADAFEQDSLGGSYSGGRGAMALKPIRLTHAGDIEIVTSERAYRFRLVPGNVFLRKVIISGAVDDSGKIVASAEPKPSILMPKGPFEKLTIIPMDSHELPPGAPFNAWADKDKMVVELNPDFPLPVFLAGKRGDAVVQYSVHEYVSRTGQKVVAFVTRRPITEAMLHMESGRLLITARPKDLGVWRDAASLPDASGDLASNQAAPRRSPIQPAADIALDGHGVMGDEIDEIIKENNRHKKPIRWPIPTPLPVEEVI